MSKEKRSTVHQALIEITPALEVSALFVVFFTFSLCEFSTKVSKNIKEGAGGVCEDCGKFVGRGNLIASHIYHSKKAKYDKEHNGMARCFSCEGVYHLRNADDPEMIGLSQKDNDTAVKSYLTRLTEKQLIEIFQKTKLKKSWENVLLRMKENQY